VLARDTANHAFVGSKFSGETISTSSKEWQHECEIAYLLNLPLPKRTRCSTT
jgi:hypothetical protein